MLALLQQTYYPDEFPLELGAEGPVEWTWLAFGFYALGLVLATLWDMLKWRRDKTREGHAVNLSGYWSDYPVLKPITLIASLCFFFVWAREAIEFSAFGLDLHVPYVPEMSFIIGFFSEGFGTHLVKMLRNLKNRATGQAL